MTTTILVRGIGDVGSAVALELFRAGFGVVVHDDAKPAHARRGTALVDALYEGKVERFDVLAKRAKTMNDVRIMLACHRAIPVVDADFGDVLRSVAPDVLVDARMRKRVAAESMRGLAAVTIGLGPNFVAGEHADWVVETAWGDDLGKPIRAGSARAYAGEPRELGGHGRERFVYAPAAGTFRTSLDIGTAVVAGAIVATIDGHPVLAPLAGRLRGLAHDGAEVRTGAKIVEVDASADGAAIRTPGERPRRIAEAVLALVREVKR